MNSAGPSTSNVAGTSRLPPSTSATSMQPPPPSTASARCSNLRINRRRQEQNPVIKYIRNVPFEYADIKPDFECGGGVGLLYLSLKWHKLHQNYIETRFPDGSGYAIKILLILVNLEDPTALLRDMNMFCYREGWTLMLCYSVEEAAEYIENLKISEKKTYRDVLRSKENYKERMATAKSGWSRPKENERQKKALDEAVKFLSMIRAVSQSDAKMLLSSFGSLKDIALASRDDLAVCPGLGPVKAQNVYNFFNNAMRS